MTFRVRLTLVYGGLLLAGGAVLLAVTYLLVAQQMGNGLTSEYPALAANLDNDRLPLAGQVEIDGRRVGLREYVGEIQAQQRRYREDMLDSLLAMGAVALGGVGAIGGTLAWTFAGRVLSPVQRITETARRIAAGVGRGLHERIALSRPHDEVKELADTFDLMLERLDGSFDGQRRFVAGAAHELRTPLAIKRALIEVAVTRPGASPDARELGRALLSVNDRHERLVDGLLILADSENEVTERHPVDLDDVAGNVLVATARGGRVRIQRADLAEAPVEGDPYLLERLVQNLVENAVKHNVPEGGWLSVRTWADDGLAVLEVANSGPVVPRYEVASLFQPFRRLDDSRAPGEQGAERGFGLGLSIVRAIACAHGGTAGAEPREGGGLVVTVSLPRRA
ncbi:sensor histidine kinase [Bailinhaonella thermotolerans]|uniref:histidine kinase n=1 Tax=Bailinhaonella thermotolerans TaxID=1070861 RepID=A0A3A4B1I2_9ACTN|nr:HAMP domain-containing sensor histidine kinase [Bailinhaonella thermotolerans]RJL35595.1 sensor histidine kinase [Bailinhaonella thermotolerans]